MKNFYYDIICPYAYLAFTRLNRQNLFDKIKLKPILLGGLFKLMNQDTNPNKNLSKIKSEYMREDIKRQASLWDINLNFHELHPVSSLKAMRLIHACDESLRVKLSEKLYNYYWQDNININEDNFINNLAQEYSCKNLEESKKLLLHATEEAFSKHIFGVPTFEINNRTYFGSDRLDLISRDIGLKLEDISWDSCVNKTIDFYFDFTSPYSYLAYIELLEAQKAGVKINFKPILLGALLKERGIEGVPMFGAHAYKAAYYLQDMFDWAQARKANFIFNTSFPLRTVMALRIALIESQAIKAFFEAAWVNNLDIGQEEIILSVLEKAGLEPNLLKRANENNIKEQLKALTQEALSKNIFGVPSFMVNNKLVFGQDRFMWLKHELAQNK